MKIAAIVLFVLMYAGMIFLPKHRAKVALGTALLFVISGILPPGQIFEAIDWNVLLMLFGTMIIVDYFIESKMPNLIADKLLNLAPNVMWVTILMSLFAGLISAFIDNVSTVLMIAPVGMAICKKLKISPVSMIICIAVSSNLQGAATLVGDTTSIMLGAYAHMDFLDFFVMKGHPGIFFAVELGALATVPIMMWIFRKDQVPIKADGTGTSVKDKIPTVTMLGMVATLILASFLPGKPAITNGLICVSFAILTILLELLFRKNQEGLSHAFEQMDFDTLLLLAGLFAVIGGITNVGIIDELAGVITQVGGKNVFLLYTIVVWGSVLISAFIDNIPYVATMLPVLRGVTAAMQASPELMYFGLLVGATLGGNITPIGASANIAGIGILKKEGHEVSFGEFMRIGVPFTLAAVLVGYLYVWIFYH
ncbi:MAG: arsenic transporter [Blautia sp.]|nr:arsenic transporter [Blautia sp.]